MTTHDGPGEDYRVTLARQTLTESQAAEGGSPGYEPARWHGRLQVVVEQLLAYIDEKDRQAAAVREDGSDV